jgi:hypothetical protein
LAFPSAADLFDVQAAYRVNTENHLKIIAFLKIISANQNQFLHNQDLQVHGHNFHNG